MSKSFGGIVPYCMAASSRKDAAKGARWRLAILTAQGQAPSSPLCVIAGLLLVAGIPLSFVAERIQKRHDIDTMREVRAFLDGAEPDQIERNRRMPKAARVALQVLAGAAGAIVFMTIVSLDQR